MSFNWGLYLQLARQLAGSADESAHRTAISRAYYSAYHAADNHLKANNVATDPQQHLHSRVWSVYAKSSQRACRQIGNVGFRLKNARVEADYKPTPAPSATLLQRSLQDAQRIIVNAPLHVPESFVPQMQNRFLNFARCLKKCFKP